MWGDLGKLFAAKGFKKLPKVQKIAESGNTALVPCPFGGGVMSALNCTPLWTLDDCASIIVQSVK